LGLLNFGLLIFWPPSGGGGGIDPSGVAMLLIARQGEFQGRFHFAKYCARCFGAASGFRTHDIRCHRAAFCH
jgi:hypothetical protein